MGALAEQVVGFCERQPRRLGLGAMPRLRSSSKASIGERYDSVGCSPVASGSRPGLDRGFDERLLIDLPSQTLDQPAALLNEHAQARVGLRQYLAGALDRGRQQPDRGRRCRLDSGSSRPLRGEPA